ncbi:MAG: enoyl-CoA hydratase/isomerase family protein [Rhizobiaceae bacterium]
MGTDDSRTTAQPGPVLMERRGSAARLTISRPERRNAINAEVLAGLRAGLAAARDDRAIRVVVITGAGDEAFSAGGDLSDLGDGDAFDAHRGRSQLTALFRDLWELGKPTIARVQGYALAGGFGIAAACDFIVASEKAVFGVPESGVGIWPYMITVPLLQTMAPKQALKLMLTGERVSAAEGLKLGFVTEVVEHGALDEAVDAFTAKLAQASPQATALGRGAFYAALNHDVDARLRMLEAMLTVNLSMPDAAEGIAAFREKRSPAWRNGD